jgi:hypothetical protein
LTRHHNTIPVDQHERSVEDPKQSELLSEVLWAAKMQTSHPSFPWQQHCGSEEVSIKCGTFWQMAMPSPSKLSTMGQGQRIFQKPVGTIEFGSESRTWPRTETNFGSQTGPNLENCGAVKKKDSGLLYAGVSRCGECVPPFQPSSHGCTVHQSNMLNGTGIRIFAGVLHPHSV